MDRLTFFSTVINSLAWPLITIVVILLLKDPLANLISRITQVKYGELDIKLREGAKTVIEEVAKKSGQKTRGAATVSPKAAVNDAWQRVELAAFETADQLGGVRSKSKMTPSEALKYLENENALDESIIDAIRNMQDLRNQAVHAPDYALTSGSALEYSIAADSLVNYLKDASSRK